MQFVLWAVVAVAILIGVIKCAGDDPRPASARIEEECKRQFPQNEFLSNQCQIQALARIAAENRQRGMDAGYNAGR